MRPKQQIAAGLLLAAILLIILSISPLSPWLPTDTAAAPPEQALKRVADFYFDVAAGDVRGHSSINKFGRNSDVDTGSIEDIWDGGGLWPEPSAAQVYTITSTSADDASDGTGAKTLEVNGLGSDGALQSETIALSGTVPVTLTNQYQMIHRMIVRSAGSQGANAGTITANGNTDGTITAQITITNSQTLMAIYKIPADNDGCITTFYAGMNRNNTTGSADVYLYAKPPGEVWQVKQINGIVSAGTSHFEHIYGVPNCFEPLTLIKMSAEASSNDTDTSAGFDMVLHPN
jgi:hypothetical protein